MSMEKKMNQRLIVFACAIFFFGCGEDKAKGSDAGEDSGSVQDQPDAAEDSGSQDTDPLEYEQEGAGLFWLYCLVGQKYDKGCTGDALILTWEQALEACPDGYRLPTLEEFMGLLGECQSDFDETKGATATCLACPASEICNEAYPGADDYGDFDYEIYHWSATEWSAVKSNAWRANFKTGEIDAHSKTKEATAVCVRSE